MPKNKRLHFKDLNALRAIALVPIFLFCILFQINSSQTGILYDVTLLIGKIAANSLDFFFFLSAFLITSHGLREYKYVGNFSLKNFFFRRALRLGSVLFFGLLFTFLIHPWLIEVLDLHKITFPSKEPYFFLVPNFLSDFTGHQLLYLSIICSIYMFIQFYVLWGLIMRFLSNQLLIISGLMVLVGIVIRVIHFMNDSSYLLDTFAYGVPIGFGAITAIAIRSEWTIVESLKDVSKNANTIIYVIGGLVFIGGYIVTSMGYISVLIPILTSLFYAYVIIEQTFGKNSFVQLKNKKILTYIGKISYGFILYQAIIGVLIMIAIESLDFDLTSVYVIAAIVMACFIGSLVVADISYKLFEKPLIRFRREFKKV